MRVFIDYRPALRAPTGVGAYVDQLSRALARRPGLEVTLFSSSWKDRLRPLEAAGRPLDAVDRRIPVRVLNLAWHRLGWPPAERLARGRFDVVHSPTPLLVPAAAAAQVVTVNDLDFLRHPERARAEARHDYPALAREHVHRADGVLAISGYAAREAGRLLDVPAERLSVCYPGVPDWVRRAERVEAPAAKARYILFVGTLEPRKNVGALLDAYGRLLAAEAAAPAPAFAPEEPAALPDLVLAGGATPAAATWLEAIRRPPLAGRVRHLGYVPEAALPELYGGAALLVLPSHDEGFGIPALEAMALGVPVVAADRGALPEVVGDAGLLVDATSPQALAGAIARVLREPALAAACAARGLERARRFDWDATAGAVEAAYERAIARRWQRQRQAAGGRR